MSGIAAFARLQESERESEDKVNRMLSRLKHRGRGRRRIRNVGGFTLGEVAAPHPMENGRGTPAGGTQVALVDGTIFYHENEEATGESIDGARLLQLYARHGVDLPGRLSGSFAFILTPSPGTLFAARDPFGLKPLYYGAVPGGQPCFASEIKALVDLCDEVKIFPPGHYYRSDLGFVKYFDGPELQQETVEEGEAARRVNELLTQAVKARIEGDEKVGVFLSGGIDSSCVAAAVARLQPGVPTFSVGSPDSADLPRAREVSEYLGTEHSEYVYDLEEILQILPQVIYHLESFDQYLVRSSVANYLVSKMAREHGVERVFCGEGGDELFAGYAYLKDMSCPESVQRELVELALTGHANGFQRVDRMTAAHSLDAEMPFMDRGLTDFAFRLPIDFKIHGQEQVEKWILRRAFERDLPEQIVWREKAKFYQGAGSAHLIKGLAEELIFDQEFEQEKTLEGGFTLRSKEELYYYRIFRRFFPNKSVLETIGRTQTVRE